MRLIDILDEYLGVCEDIQRFIEWKICPFVSAKEEKLKYYSVLFLNSIFFIILP